MDGHGNEWAANDGAANLGGANEADECLSSNQQMAGDGCAAGSIIGREELVLGGSMDKTLPREHCRHLGLRPNRRRERKGRC